MKVRRIDRDVLVEPVIGHQSILRNRIARDHLHFRGRENAIPNSARLGVFAAPGSLSLSCTVEFGINAKLSSLRSFAAEPLHVKPVKGAVFFQLQQCLVDRFA
jgi:hypothetical protein